MSKIWGGRFTSEPKEDVLAFNSSENIELDKRLVEYDIQGSIAHVKMLQKQKIIKKDEASAILKALGELLKEWKEGRFKLDPNLEDVHMNVETAVSKKTSHGKKMHVARSRNDQVLLDMRMYMRDEILEIIELIKKLKKIKLKSGPMVGYTHTRVAQPITIGLWSEAFSDGLARDIERLQECYKRVNQNPLGACALAGTSWDIDRNYTAKLLGFSSVQKNELDTISSRGELEAEMLSHLSLLMARASGIAEELIWLSEKGLIELPDDLCTGSSIMPNKKNPDILELVRARTGRVYGVLMQCLVVKKGLISGYHSDMQETKYAVMQGIDTVKSSLEIMALVFKGMTFNQKKIMHELDSGFAQATKIADYLAASGMSFREAHAKSGNLVKFCEKNNKTISQVEANDAEKILGVKIGENNWKKLLIDALLK
ncbi:argininosuccinate lyase [Candidatus Micrarchaeota archaeon]|nr:argininosuccinate lyase [Candidatus Micrarchaeota archaeon]MBU1682086.1 argininosuccinate lyase [Candidatus Micrarchaeota archaeon]